MQNGKTIHGCGFEETLVAYAYGEAEETEKHAFDAHLASCVECSAELAAFRGLHDAFASLVNAQSLDSPLANPALGTAIKDNHRSLWESIVGAMNLTPAAFAAGAVLIAAIGFFVFASMRYEPDSAASELASNVGGPTRAVEIQTETQPGAPEVQTVRSAAIETPISKPETGDRGYPKARSPKSPRLRKDSSAPTIERQTLSEVEDSADDSLRLSDIFAELSMD